MLSDFPGRSVFRDLRLFFVVSGFSDARRRPCIGGVTPPMFQRMRVFPSRLVVFYFPWKRYIEIVDSKVSRGRSDLEMTAGIIQIDGGAILPLSSEPAGCLRCRGVKDDRWVWSSDLRATIGSGHSRGGSVPTSRHHDSDGGQQADSPDRMYHARFSLLIAV